MRMFIAKLIPDSIKVIFKLKLVSQLLNYSSARSLSSKSKRLDICAAQFAHFLHCSNYDLKGKVCLEVGSGYVLSHAIICFILGAEKIILTDISFNAFPSFLKSSIHKSSISLIRDILSPFEEHHVIRERLNYLLNIKQFTFEELHKIGIVYVAPIDLSHNVLTDNVDFIYSWSVMEHVPLDDIQSLIQNMTNILKPNAVMFHAIHLEDHYNIDTNPFGFLSEKTYSTREQNSRGNRVRRSTWEKLFTEGLTSNLIYSWSRPESIFPDDISSEVEYIDEEDVKTSHIGILGVKS